MRTESVREVEGRLGVEGGRGGMYVWSVQGHTPPPHTRDGLRTGGHPASDWFPLYGLNQGYPSLRLVRKMVRGHRQHGTNIKTTVEITLFKNTFEEKLERIVKSDHA